MNFQYNYNLSGSSRKPLIEAMSQMLDQPAVYQGAPSFSYTVGDYTVDRNGVLTCGENVHPEIVKTLVEALRERGFVAENAEGVTNAGEENTLNSSEPPNAFTVEIPDTGFTPEAKENLKKIVASKKTVLAKALGADGLPIIERDGRLIFPWFTLHGLDGEADGYSRLITAICKMAKEQKRVTAVERPVENAKFAMRLFLVRLGFIGEEYKTARKILLRNLTGNGSWKSGHRPERDTNAVILPSPAEAVLTAAQVFTATLEEADAAENSLHKEDEGDDSYGK